MTHQRLLKINEAAAALLSVGAKEVYIFGSAADGTDRDDSDVEFAVTGLPAALFFKAMGLARRLIRKPVDLIDLDESNPFTDYLKKHGALKRVAGY